MAMIGKKNKSQINSVVYTKRLYVESFDKILPKLTLQNEKHLLDDLKSMKSTHFSY